MKIIVNDKEVIVEGEVTLAGVITLRGIDPGTVVVEYNSELVSKDTWDTIVLKENDRIEILRFVGGG